jgi:hypothetical protein
MEQLLRLGHQWMSDSNKQRRRTMLRRRKTRSPVSDRASMHQEQRCGDLVVAVVVTVTAVAAPRLTANLAARGLQGVYVRVCQAGLHEPDDFREIGRPEVLGRNGLHVCRRESTGDASARRSAYGCTARARGVIDARNV